MEPVHVGVPRPLLQGLRRRRRARAWSRWPNGQSWVCLIHRREEYRESRRHQDRDAKLLPRAHICAWERLNLQSCQKCQVNCQIVGGCFFFICQKKKYAKLRYQTLGDALTSICMCMSFTRGMISWWCLRSLVETDAAIVDKRLLFFNLGPGRASVDHRGTAGWWRASP